MLDLRFVARDLRRLDETSAEVVACGVYRDERPLSGLAGLLDWRLAGKLSRIAKQNFFLGDVGEVLAVPVRPRLPFDKVLAFGLGPKATFAEATFERVLERTLDAIAGLNVKKAVVELPGRGNGAISAQKAAELMADRIGDDERDTLTFVEDVEDQRTIEKHLADRRRSALRANTLGTR